MASRVPSRANRLLKQPPKIFSTIQIRQLSLHEYQSQNILRKAGIPVPEGRIARSPLEVRKAIEELGVDCVLKAQILRGGREKGQFENGLQGGIHVISNARQGEIISSQMFGSRLRTNQTTSEGLPVDMVYVAEKAVFDQEWYLAFTIDREHYSPAIVISKKGGIDIETIAKKHPKELFTFLFGLSTGITHDLIDKIATDLGLSDKELLPLDRILKNMYRIFVEKDATFLEVNPLVWSTDGKLTCLDSKFTFDDAAAHRQTELFSLRDKVQEVGDEVAAKKYNLVYVRMNGNIGNVVNGAGLAMATNDAIGHSGGASANFLDAGGKATTETMKQAFGIITRDERVKAILVNIYGGLTRGDMIAEAIIGATNELDIRVPMVVRLQGTNSEDGLKLLKQANLGLHVEPDFGKAAKRVVELANSK